MAMMRNIRAVAFISLVLVSSSVVFLPATATAEFDNTNILIEEAVNHIYQQRFKQAHSALKQAFEQSPRHPGVHFNLGRLFEMTGNFPEALREYQMAVVLDPSMVAARRGIARCSVEIKRIRGSEEASVLDEAAREITSRNGSNQSGRSGDAGRRVAVPPARPPSAPSNASRVVVQNPVSQAVRTTAENQKMMPGYGDKESGTPTPSMGEAGRWPPNGAVETAPSVPAMELPPMPASAQLPQAENLQLPPLPQAVQERVREAPSTEEESRAEALMERGDYSKAYEILNGIATQNPDNPHPLFLLGKLFSLKGELFSGIKYLEEAIKVDERQYPAYYLLAQDYSRVNLLDDAIRNYLIYFGVKPQAGVAVEIARTYERMGRDDLAKEYYGKANAMNPGNPNLQSRLSDSETEVANDLYLRANHAFTTDDFPGALTLYQQALNSRGLDPTYRRDAERKVQAAKLRSQAIAEEARPGIEGFQQTRQIYGTVNLQYPQLADITFKTKFTGPVTVEWRGFVARKFTRYGQDFLVMIKELSNDELDQMRRDQNDYRLNPNFTNQPVFLLTTPRGGFPKFADKGKFITFTGKTDWRFYDVINDLGQSMKLPAFDFLAGHP